MRIGVANAKTSSASSSCPRSPTRRSSTPRSASRPRTRSRCRWTPRSLDYQALDVVDTPDGLRQRVLLVAARKDMVGRVLLSARDAGLQASRGSTSPPSAWSARSPRRPTPPTGTSSLYLAVGGLTNLAVAEGATCTFTRVVGGGVEALAVELAERRGAHARARPRLAGPRRARRAGQRDGRRRADPRGRPRGARRRGPPHRRRGPRTPSTSTSRRAAGGGATRCVLTGPGRGDPGLRRARWARSSGSRSSVGTVEGAPAELGARALQRRRRPRDRGGRLMRAVNLIPAEERRGAGGAGGRSGRRRLRAARRPGRARRARRGVHPCRSRHVSDKRAELDARGGAGCRRARPAPRVSPPSRDLRAVCAPPATATCARWPRAASTGRTRCEEVARVIPSDVSLTTLTGTVAPGVALQAGGGGASSGLRGALPLPALEINGCATEPGLRRPDAEADAPHRRRHPGRAAVLGEARRRRAAAGPRPAAACRLRAKEPAVRARRLLRPRRGRRPHRRHATADTTTRRCHQ